MISTCPIHHIKLGGRKGIGPTGKKSFMILVNYCLRPGCNYEAPAFPERLGFMEKTMVEKI